MEIGGTEKGEGGDSPPTKASPRLKNTDLEAELEAWVKSLDGQFGSRLEKLRSKLIGQKEQATGSAREFLKRKIRILDEKLDGPMPPPSADTPTPKPKAPAAESKPLSPDELLEGARYLVDSGRPHLLTRAQKAALKAAGK